MTASDSQTASGTIIQNTLAVTTFLTNGSEALAPIYEEVVTETVTKTTFSTASRTGILGAIVSFIFSLQGDSVPVQKIIPVDYMELQNGKILSPNGTIFPDAYAVWDYIKNKKRLG